MYTSYLLDKDFLRQLDEYPHKEKYAKIISLDYDENQLEEIQGKITSGSINIDGTSAVRRTCNLSLVTQEVNINDFYWNLNTKFKLYIGLKNDINPIYPDIIWFPMGVYLIVNFNESLNSNSHTISITGKDKMCLLNGDVSGTVNSLSWDFGAEEYTDRTTGVVNTTKRLIKDIVRDAVQEYAKEPFGRIQVNDLDEAAVELMEYRGKEPLYMFIDNEANICTQVTLNGKQKVYYSSDGELDLTPKYEYNDVYYKTKQELVQPYIQDIKNYLEAMGCIYKPSYNYAIEEVVLSHITSEQEAQFSIFLDKNGNLSFERNTDIIDTITLEAPRYPVYSELILEECQLDEMEEKGLYYDHCVDLNLEGAPDNTPTQVLMSPDDKRIYRIAKVVYGQTAGYRSTDLTYAGELILSTGETITSMLDKIVKMLGEYEYFYDLEGNFVFQRKKTYVNVSFTPIINNRNETYVENASQTSAVQYSFRDNNLISAIQNTPNLGSFKNDYSIWGKRIGATGQELPVHIRYGISKKPTYYKSYNGTIYITNDEKLSYAIDRDGNIVPGTREEIEAELRSEAKQIVLGPMANFQKHKNPNGLPEDWWEIDDWAEYYKAITGAYPEGTIGQYANGGNGSTDMTPIALTKYFKKAATGDYKDYKDNANAYIFNIDYNVDYPGSITIGYINHGYNCDHSYSYFLDRIIMETGTSYIYKPIIPEAELARKINEEYEALVEKYNYTYYDTTTAENVTVVDWRELIYQMALDYRHYYYDDDNFNYNIQENNGITLEGRWRYEKGITNYEQYYVDLEGFWRQLYCPESDYRPITLTKKKFDEAKENEYFTRQWDKVNGLYVYTDIKDLEQYSQLETYYAHGWQGSWNPEIIEAPEGINFWFDFLEGDADLSRYSTHIIGDRTKTLNDDNIKAIYFRETPTVIFFDPKKEAEIDRKTGYTYIQCPAYMEQLFHISTQGKSAMDELNINLYNHSYCTESVSLTTLPIYYLEPNARIFVFDGRTGINGEYIVSRLSFQLAHGGTMSISATKAPERLY